MCANAVALRMLKVNTVVHKRNAFRLDRVESMRAPNL